MTEEQEARITVEELCIPGWAKTVDNALDDYRDAIVAAMTAEYDAKLGDIRLDAERWRWVRENGTRMCEPTYRRGHPEPSGDVLASFTFILPSHPAFHANPEAAIDAARTPSPEPTNDR